MILAIVTAVVGFVGGVIVDRIKASKEKKAILENFDEEIEAAEYTGYHLGREAGLQEAAENPNSMLGYGIPQLEDPNN